MKTIKNRRMKILSNGADNFDFKHYLVSKSTTTLIA
jgi:hypothetical protein